MQEIEIRDLTPLEKEHLVTLTHINNINLTLDCMQAQVEKTDKKLSLIERFACGIL